MLVTTGSQAADLSTGSMTEAPSPRPSGRSWALWQRLAQGRTDFGNPDVFFGPARIPNSLWVTFTVTDTGTEFVNQIAALTGSEAGRGGLVTLKDSGWVLSLSVFHQPEIIGQPRARASGGATVCIPSAPAISCANHDGVHRRGNPGGDAAATAVRQAIGRDQGVIDLRALLHALRQQHLAASEPRRQASAGSGGGHQSRTHRSVRRGPGKLPSPSNAPSARRGKRFTACSIVAPRRRPSIRASTIRRRYSVR